MTEDQQKLVQKLLVEQKALESNIEVAQQSLELLQASLSSYRRGLNVVEEMEKKNGGEEMLISVGGDLLIEVQLINAERVIRDVGSGVRITQSLPDAKTQTEGIIAAYEQQYARIAQEYQNMTTRAASLNAQLQELVSQIQGERKGV